MTEAKKRYKKKIKVIRIELYPTERDIIEKIESMPQYSPYIKGLIRKDIENERHNFSRKAE